MTSGNFCPDVIPIVLGVNSGVLPFGISKIDVTPKRRVFNGQAGRYASGYDGFDFAL